MTPEQLLIPRYKVIADYPKSIYTVGDIIDCETPDDCTLRLWPAIFKPLQWWEDRKPEDMPLYIKEIDSLSKIGEVIKVKEWYMEDIDTDVPCFMDEKDNYFTWVRGFIPATEQEYLTYINSKK